MTKRNFDKEILGISKTTFAGIAIALGCCLYLFAPNNIIGAVLFSCGLLCVRIYKLTLFTGKVQFLITSKYPWYDYPLMLLGNLLGASLIAVITMTMTGDLAAPIAAAKAAQPFGDAFIKGIGCGMLMSLATYENSPLWICLLCVPAFILAGFNHCIADWYYALVAEKIGISFLATILGNIVGGAILLNPHWTNT